FLTLQRAAFTDLWVRETRFSFDLVENPVLLKLLGEEVGFKLLPQEAALEVPVGPYRADILCLDQDSLETVLIENQRGPSDHDHLGKLLTYASGLKARNLIWIAESFNEEHLSAIRWLNQRSDS